MTGTDRASQHIPITWLHPTSPKAIHMSEYGLDHLHSSINWQRGSGKVHSAKFMICARCLLLVVSWTRGGKSPVVDLIIAAVRVELNRNCTLDNVYTRTRWT